MDPDTKMKYKDPDYLETIRGNVPLTIVNGTIQTARQTHVSNTALNLASNKKSISFVRRWAKETTDRVSLSFEFQVYSLNQLALLMELNTLTI
jgi:hypothetical protein